MKIKTFENIKRIEYITFLAAAMAIPHLDNDLFNHISNSDLSLIFSSCAVANIYTYDRLMRLTSGYKEIKSLYGEVLNKTTDLVNDFKFNDPISIFALYVFMYRGGYLSNQKRFNYTKKHLKNLSLLCGADIINGVGVCCSISSMLTDIYKNLGFSSQNLSVRTGFFKIISNHLITLVEKSGKAFILDPTNDFLLFEVENNELTKADTLFSFAKVSFLDATFYSLIGRYTTYEDIKKAIHNINLPHISNEEYREIYSQATEFIKKNLDALEAFYNKNETLYKDLSSLINERSFFVKQLTPMTK